MTESRGGAALTNVFVLMLENHSFDNVFAMSGIPGIRKATTHDCNAYDGKTYCVVDGAPPSMTTDPGHEFTDVLTQLTGEEAASGYRGGPYPPITNCGFASSYATSTSEGTGTPTPDHIGDILACFRTEEQLSVLYQLATEFAICDNWFSSLPGPTWPNRFFVHGASSAGWTDSPHVGDEVEWETVLGFRYENGSIFQALSAAGHRWRLYQDKDNDFRPVPPGPEFGGWISQAASLQGVSLLDIHSFRRFASDLAKTGDDSYTQYPYTFIEPNFGKSFFAPQPPNKGPTYKGGSSQHPEDDAVGAEGLTKAVYEAIRNSPVWETSLLVIVYDEHGGFYDSVPPGPAVPPGDKPPPFQQTRNSRDFDFARLGVRVPAVVVSPRIPTGTVDNTLYDHASILATLEKWLCMEPLTERDKNANHLLHLLTQAEPRDCPTTLTDPAPGIDLELRAVEPADESLDDPLPDSGNLIGFLQVLHKADLELHSDDDETAVAARREQFGRIRTKAEARAYAQTVRTAIDAAQSEPGCED